MDALLVPIFFLLAGLCLAKEGPVVPSRVHVHIEGRGCTPVALAPLAGAEGIPLNVQLGELASEGLNPCSLKQFRLEGSGDWGRAACGLGPAPLEVSGAAADLLLRSSCSRAANVTLEVAAGLKWKQTALGDRTRPVHSTAAVLAQGRKLLQGPAGKAAVSLAAASGTNGNSSGGIGSSGAAWASYAASPVPSPPPPSPTLTFSTLVCCCRNSSAVFDFTNSTPANCCCGTYRQCCAKDSLLTSICNGSSMCGVVMVTGVVAFSGIICCIAAVVLYKQRVAARERRAARAAEATTPATGPLAEAAATAPAMSEIELQGKTVTPPTPEQVGAAAECPVCLESLTVTPDNWVNFPCLHGSCMSCLRQMLRHNRRRTSHRHILPCPLCRKLAVGRLATAASEGYVSPGDEPTAEASSGTPSEPSSHALQDAEPAAGEGGNPGGGTATAGSPTDEFAQQVRDGDRVARPQQG